MVCECQFDPGIIFNVGCIVFHVICHVTNAEQDDPEDACGENCLNRLLMIEW